MPVRNATKFRRVAVAAGAAVALAIGAPAAVYAATTGESAAAPSTTTDDRAPSKITTTAEESAEGGYDVTVKGTCTGDRVELWDVVRLVLDGTEVASAEFDDAGVAVFPTGELAAGTHQVKAVFDGNDLYAPGETETTLEVTG